MSTKITLGRRSGGAAVLLGELGGGLLHHGRIVADRGGVPVDEVLLLRFPFFEGAMSITVMFGAVEPMRAAQPAGRLASALSGSTQPVKPGPRGTEFLGL